jgi:hypothetical protein
MAPMIEFGELAGFVGSYRALFERFGLSHFSSIWIHNSDFPLEPIRIVSHRDAN